MKYAKKLSILFTRFPDGMVLEPSKIKLAFNSLYEVRGLKGMRFECPVRLSILFMRFKRSFFAYTRYSSSVTFNSLYEIQRGSPYEVFLSGVIPFNSLYEIRFIGREEEARVAVLFQFSL